MSDAARRLAITLIVCVGSASFAHGTTYYVRASGDDRHDGLSPQTAFARMRPAALLLREPGDRVIVGPGVYREGNIKPRGSGSPSAPIVFLADVTGALTHDPPGPVTIVPPNTFDATTGFIVYGRHAIVFQGFDIDGAVDAGIQVRPHSRTGVDSAGIVVRNTRIRNGRRRGIHVIAVGDVMVVDNTLTGNGAGVVLRSGESGELRPLVRDNVIEENRLGIGLEATVGGAIVANDVRANGKGVNLIDCDALAMNRNRILQQRDRALTAQRTNGAITENVIDRGVRLWVNGTLVVTKNQLASQDFGLDIYVDAGGALQLLENELPRTHVSRGARVDVAQNRGRLLEVESAEAVTVTDNRFTERIEVAGTAVEISRNQAADVEVRSTQAIIRSNQITDRVAAFTDSATVTGNRATLLLLARRRVWPSGEPAAESGPFLVKGNVTDDVLSVGQSRAPVSSIVAENNVVGGKLRGVARHRVEMRHNEARGITCILSAPNSALVLAENTSRGSTAVGLSVRGAARALIENNTATDNAHRGLAIRRGREVTIAGNRLLANAAGGVEVNIALAGDCNRDNEVRVDEIVTVAQVVLRRPGPTACPAADANFDRRTNLNDLLLALAAAMSGSDVGAVDIRSNRVEGNGRFGIKVRTTGPVRATDNHVVRNGGVALAVHAQGRQDESGIVGNVLGVSGAEGLLLEGVSGARVESNVIFSSHEAGVLLREAPRAAVVNNLVYANGDDGISVGLGATRPAPDVTLLNNTVYGNTGWGVTIGSPGTPSTGTVMLNNILHRNARGGVATALASEADLLLDFNLNTDGYAPNVPPGATDLVADPRLVTPAGADGVLGGEGFADDDFHLRRVPASPAIDAGSDSAATLGITGSAVAGLETDVGPVDLGYHYGSR